MTDLATKARKFAQERRIGYAEHWDLLNQLADELKAKDERIAEMENLSRSETNIIGAYEKSFWAIREALGLSEFDDHELVIDEINLKLLLLAEQASRLRCLQEAVRVAEDSVVIMEGVGLLYCMENTGAKEQYVAAIKDAFVPVVEGQRPTPVWVTEIEQDGDDTLIHLSDGRCATLMPPISVADEGFKALASGSFAAPVVEEHRHYWTEREGDTQNLYCECGEISRPLSAVERQIPTPDTCSHNWKHYPRAAMFGGGYYCSGCGGQVPAPVSE